MATNYLVTGAGRGLGHALTKSLLLQPQTNVIATVRSVESGKILEKLAIHSTSKIVWICVEFDVETTASSLSAISELPKIYPWLSHIDTVVVNAGISDSPDKAIETPAAALYSHLAVNAVAPLALFQASWPLLKLAQCPRFVVLSSIVGSTQSVPETSAFGSLAYGVRKAALNYLVRKIGAENEGLAVMAIHPGWIKTDLGNARARAQGLQEAPVSLSDSVQGIMAELNAMRRGQDQGFRTFDNKDIPW